MSSLFDNIINRVSKNNKKHRTQKVLDKRTFCRGCGFHVLKKTYKIHKKLFRNSDGIWLPHNMQPSRQKINKPLNLLKSEEMDKIKKMGKIKNAEKRQKSKKIYKNFCAFCGNCCIDGECKFDDKNFFEEQILHFCCLFAQNSNFLDQIILHNKCEYCQNEHFHFCLEKSKEKSNCANCASKFHSVKDCKEQKIETFYAKSEMRLPKKLAFSEAKISLIDLPIDQKSRPVPSFQNNFLESINDFVLKSSFESRTQKRKNTALEISHKLKRPKNFYFNRFGMPLISARDCSVLEDEVVKESGKTLKIAHRSKDGGAVGLKDSFKLDFEESKFMEGPENPLARKKEDILFKEKNGKIDITTTGHPDFLQFDK